MVLDWGLLYVMIWAGVLVDGNLFGYIGVMNDENKLNFNTPTPLAQ